MFQTLSSCTCYVFADTIHTLHHSRIYYGGVTVLNNDGTATATTANELPPMVRWREALHRRGWEEEEEVRSRCGALCPLRLFVSEKREVRGLETGTNTGYYVYRTYTLFIMSLSSSQEQETALPLSSLSLS